MSRPTRRGGWAAGGRLRLRALALVLAVVAALVVTPAVAYALPGDPEAPAPEKPGDGTLGWLDSQGGPSLDGSVYGSYGYAGLRWYTYDLGVGGDLRDPWAVVDTGFGNWMFTVAKFMVASANSLHQANRPDSLTGLDPVLTKGTSTVHDALFQPFLPIALLLLAVLLLWRTHRSDLPASIRAVGWAILVMTIAIGLFQYPVRAVNAVDQAESGTIAQIDNGFAQSSGLAGNATLAQSETLVDTVLYRQWLRGEFGNPDSVVAKKYGRDLLDAQAYTRNERLLLDNRPDSATALALLKNGKYVDTAGRVKAEDPTAYEYLSGHGHSRMGAGFVAVAVAAPTAGFRAVADLLVFAARIILRLLVIFFPALAVAGILVPGPVRTAFVAGAAALVNSVVFSLGAGLNALAANILLGPDVRLPTWLAVVFLGIISLIMWRAFKPFRHLTVMVNPNHNFAAGALSFGAAGGMFRRFASAAAGAYVGTRAARDDDEPDPVTRRFRPETHSVPDPGGTEQTVRVTSVRMDTDDVGLPGVGASSPLALPAPRSGSRTVGAPRGLTGGRTEDLRVFLSPSHGGDHGTDGRAAVHVTETLSGEDRLRPAGEDAAFRDVFRPGHRPEHAGRTESLRATDAEVVDGREVYVIYRPGGGMEARDVR
ncbi:MAG: hypothetical protein HY241_02450 [Actinobacteria bacterium]|nr:hypothetical protein [Actinomycetota bacterium]